MPRLLHVSRPEGLPASLATLRTPCYLHRTPTRLMWPLLAVALLLALGGLLFVAWRALQGRAGATEWLLGAFILPFAVLLLRPATWRPHIGLAADERGVFFVGTSPTVSAVFVPWCEVGPLSVEWRSTPGVGAARTVVLRIDDASTFWDAARQSRFIGAFLASPDADGRREVAIGNAGVSPDETRAALEALRDRMRGDGLSGRETAGRTPGAASGRPGTA